MSEFVDVLTILLFGAPLFSDIPTNRHDLGDTGIFIAHTPVLAEGRIELLWYVMEQSISHNYHRYGNLGPRGDEDRRPVE